MGPGTILVLGCMLPLSLASSVGTGSPPGFVSTTVFLCQFLEFLARLLQTLDWTKRLSGLEGCRPPPDAHRVAHDVVWKAGWVGIFTGLWSLKARGWGFFRRTRKGADRLAFMR